MAPRVASVLIPVLVALALSAPASAQQRQPAQPRPAQEQPPAQPPVADQPAAIRVKLAVIDIDLIRRDAVAVKDINGQMESFERAIVAEIQKEEEGLRNADQELSRQRTILSAEAFNDRRRELGQKVADAQRNAQMRRQELNRSYTEAMNEVQKALNTVILEVAQENSLTLILRKDNTIMVAKPLEITDQVLQRLDKSLPKIKVPAPGRPAEASAAKPAPAGRGR